MRAEDITPEKISMVDPWYWAYWNKIKLQVGEFGIEGHKYLVKPMRSRAKVRVEKKGAQMGFTEKDVLRSLHGLIYGYYPLGILYLFPTNDDVLDFGKTRFKALMEKNPGPIGRYIGNTEAAELKQIGKGFLYLRGARVGTKIQGMKEESTKLRSIPVDKIVFDEVDLMNSRMVDEARERSSHSKIQEEVYLSTPTIPDHGIDRLYNASDMQTWNIKCRKCGRDCCLERDFPECVKFKDGKAYRACVKCGALIHPSWGEWVANSKSDIEGYWISQLNSEFVDPGHILKLFENPPNGNLQEVYNSKLAQAYIAEENRLTVNDIYQFCGTHIIGYSDMGPCGMGIDVQGKDLKVVIGKRIQGKKRIVYIGAVPEWDDAIELGLRFSVSRCGVDFQPETRNAREFQRKAASQGDKSFSVYLIRYRDSLKGGDKADTSTGVVELARTEAFDMVGNYVRKGSYLFPRKCPVVEDFAKQMSNSAKVLEEDERRAIKVYRYKRVGGIEGDHFRNAMNYLEFAMNGLQEATDNMNMNFARRMAGWAESTEEYNPLTFGLKGGGDVWV